MSEKKIKDAELTLEAATEEKEVKPKKRTTKKGEAKAEPAKEDTVPNEEVKEEKKTRKKKESEIKENTAPKGRKRSTKASSTTSDKEVKEVPAKEEAEQKPEPKKLTKRENRRLVPYDYRSMNQRRAEAPREIRSVFGTNTEVSETMVGLPSEDIYMANRRFMISDEEREQNLYTEMIRYHKYGEILWGTLVSVDDEAQEDTIYACILWNDILVKIPDYLFLEPTYRFGKTYDSMSKEEKFRRRHSTISFMLGAKVCFVIDELTRTLITDKYDALYNTYELSVKGNRRKAMEIMRDIFFFHENRKSNTPGQMREIKEGDVVNARIVQVKEESILVECGGVETRIPAGLLSIREYYTNCTDAFSSGDMIKVRAKKVYVDKKEHTVHLSLTGQVINPAKAVKNVKIGSCYLGTVVKCNEDRHTYTIMLTNGVPCTVFFEFVFGHIPLVKGDKVRVTVNNIYANDGMGFVAGAAQKL